MYDSTTQFSNHRNENCGDLVAMKFGQSDENGYRECCGGEGVQLRPNNHQESMESDDSGVSSPPLWKNSPSPPKSPSQPLLGRHNNYRSLSPNSRLQAIMRGQFELMEMVKNMPESSYELSLKDLVEHRHRSETQIPQVERSDGDDNNNMNNQTLKPRGVVVKVRRLESKKNDGLMRSNSFENKGLFLKMVFPISLKYKKKKNLEKNNNTISGKVSPKPEGLKDCGERDWWKIRFTGSSGSDSSRASDNNSGSSGDRYASVYLNPYGFCKIQPRSFNSCDSKSREVFIIGIYKSRKLNLDSWELH